MSKNEKEENAHSSMAEKNIIFASENCINYSQHVGSTIHLFYNVLGNGIIIINKILMNENVFDE